MKAENKLQAGQWYAACLYAGYACWGVVRDLALPGTQPGGAGYYQQEAAPGAYATYERARAEADNLNRLPASRLRPADHCGMLPWPDDDYHPHPWELK